MDLEKIKARLIMNYPWVASCLLRLTLKESDKYPIMATDGTHIFYNPKGCGKKSEADLAFIILHEGFHCMMLHHTRIKHLEDARLANIAADYAINPLVRDFQLAIPMGLLYKHEYEGKSMEWIYDHLQKNPDQQPPTDSDCIVIPAPDGSNSSEDSNSSERATPEEWSQILVDTFYNAKAYGIIKNDAIDRHFRNATAKSPDLLERLSTYVSKSCKSDYSYKRPHRKIRGDVMLPTLSTQKKLDLVVIIDTSGSISDDDLGKFASVLDSVRKTYVVDCTVLSADTSVRSSQTFSYNEPIVWDLSGGGGTDFADPLRYVTSKFENPVVVYFTDGYCDSFGAPTPYPVMWASDLQTFFPPFGVRCLIK